MVGHKRTGLQRVLLDEIHALHRLEPFRWHVPRGGHEPPAQQEVFQWHHNLAGPGCSCVLSDPCFTCGNHFWLRSSLGLFPQGPPQTTLHPCPAVSASPWYFWCRADVLQHRWSAHTHACMCTHTSLPSSRLLEHLLCAHWLQKSRKWHNAPSFRFYRGNYVDPCWWLLCHYHPKLCFGILFQGTSN